MLRTINPINTPHMSLDLGLFDGYSRSRKSEQNHAGILSGVRLGRCHDSFADRL